MHFSEMPPSNIKSLSLNTTNPIINMSEQTSTLKVALCQTHLYWEDPQANFAHFDEILGDLPSGLDVIVLPEMFSTGFSMRPEQNADQSEGKTLAWLRRWAAHHQAALVGSAIIEENDQYYNRLFFVEPTGQYQHYNKKHLFSLAGEEKVYQPGDKKLIVDFRGWRINPQICYDLRFPVWCRNAEDFDLQLFVANWPERRRRAWQALLKARAIENMAYVIGLNRVGKDGNGVDHSGDSALIDPLGQLISDISPHQSEVGVYQIDRSYLFEQRQRFGFLNDRDAFSLKS
jgi:predicted amidohydrolase